MKVKLLSPKVVEALEGREFKKEEIEKMSAEEVFNEFCNWEGLINWGPVIWEVIENIKSAKTVRRHIRESPRDIIKYGLLKEAHSDLTARLSEIQHECHVAIRTEFDVNSSTKNFAKRIRRMVSGFKPDGSVIYKRGVYRE